MIGNNTILQKGLNVIANGYAINQENYDIFCRNFINTIINNPDLDKIRLSYTKAKQFIEYSDLLLSGFNINIIDLGDLGIIDFEDDNLISFYNSIITTDSTIILILRSYDKFLDTIVPTDTRVTVDTNIKKILPTSLICIAATIICPVKENDNSQFDIIKHISRSEFTNQDYNLDCGYLF